MSQELEVNNNNTAIGIKLPEAFLNGIVSCSPGAIAIVDEQTYKIVFANKQFENIFGYSDKDIEADGFSFLSLLDAFSVDRLKAQFLSTLNNKEDRVRYVVYKLKGKNGQYVSIYLYTCPVDQMGDVRQRYFHLLMLPDLSKWSLPFTSFDTRELFLEQFAKEDFGTFEWIANADKVFWSDGIYKIYEVDKGIGSLNREFISKYVHPADKERVDAILQNAIVTGNEIDIEYRIVTGKQNVKVIHALGRMINDKDGDVIKLTGSIRDITEQRTAEQDMKDNVEDLNRSNRELEEFAYVASHDMQEPLRKITTFSDRLAEKYKNVLQGDGAMYLERMMVSAENMRQLINNLLDFSRITKSTQPFVPVNLNFIVHQVKTDLELNIEETGAVINSTGLPTITASLTQMKQLFTNILNNAIKFHKEGIQPVVNITSSTLMPNEVLQYDLLPGTTYHKIEVLDNGIGFESEYAARIFQIFQRLHGKAEYPGSGIGLAICKKIVEHHHGIIYADNIAQQGARFVFILPEEQVEN